MDTIRTFFLLCLGYGVIILILAGLQSAEVFGGGSPSLPAAMIMVVPAFFYPPAALCYLFYRQSGRKPWFHGTWASIALGVCVVLGVYFFVVKNSNDPYSALGYFVLGLFIGVPLSIVIIACACVQQIQLPITRSLGLCIFIGLAATAAINAYGYLNISDFDLFNPLSLIAAAITLVASLLGLMFATFKGEKEDVENSG